MARTIVAVFVAALVGTLIGVQLAASRFEKKLDQSAAGRLIGLLR